MAIGKPMKIRAQLKGDEVEVKALMSHEMETGQRKGADGNLVPAWFIQEVTATNNGKTVLQANWSQSVAKNPFLSFSFKGGKVGDKVVVSWKDNKGDTRSDEATVA